MAKRQLRQQGFTLVEAIVVMVVLGVIGATVSIFINGPLRGAVDVALRADLTDAADTAIRRMERDLRTALPNSLRVTSVGTTVYLEYLEVRTAGRYRTAPSGAATTAASCPDTNANALADEDVLDFTASDSCFRSTGTVPNLASIAANSDFLVVFNLGPGISGSNAYEFSGTGGNKSLITSAAVAAANENRITFTSITFPFASPGNRFHVISGPVTYVCDPAAGQLRRLSGYAISPAQAAPPAGPTANILVSNNISSCAFTYTATANERAGVLAATLGLTRSGEIVTLHHETSINNAP
jgi:MSHA biogenesis protein MshO